MACVAWCGIGHQAMHIVHLKPTWCVWHGVVLDIKLCTSFTSNLHVCVAWCGIGHQAMTIVHLKPTCVCGMVWYRTSSYDHRSPQTYMACVAWCGIGHQELTYELVWQKPVQWDQLGPSGHTRIEENKTAIATLEAVSIDDIHFKHDVNLRII